jgi:hypothetical protein
MPRVSLGVLAVVVLPACHSDAVAPSTSTTPQDAVASYVAPSVTLAVAQTTKSRTAGLDDVLARLVPVLGVSGLKGPLTVLRDSLTATNPTARGALLDAAYVAVDRFEPKASPGQLPDVWAIRVALDAVRADEAIR